MIIIFRVFFAIGLLVLAIGCQPSNLEGNKPDGTEIKIMFYPGRDNLDDLIIIDGVNYFGKVGYQRNDPLGDISFRLNSDERIRAECTKVGKNSIDKPECKEYTVFNSNFSLIPKNSVFGKPNS